MDKNDVAPQSPLLCVDCGQPKDTTGKRCSACIAKAQIVARLAKIKARKDEGVCKCGGPRDSERHTSCAKCRESAKSKATKRRQALRDQGLCSQCGKVESVGGKECPECADFRRRYREDNLERQQEWYRRYNQRNRRQVITAYGGKCACCGEADYRFLTIDHINGDGASHKAEIKQSLTTWLKAQGYPQDGYQCLCYNCNCGKWLYGECPHKMPLNTI